ncbi:MAG: alpha-galactosidase [Planctomycetota bacterium]|jgi:alpha-galactosidase
MPRITMLGAGSFFTGELMKDVMLIDGLKGGEINLVDIDPRRLEISRKYVEALAARIGKKWKINASTDRRKVMKRSDYVINSIEVAGVRTVKVDYEVPKKYGVDQCIGDTIGPGGIFKALRTIPVWLEMIADCHELCPDAMVLNYTNPMSMLMLAAVRVTNMPVLGLCHSVQGTSHLLARYAGIPYERLKWRCAGINHMAWFTELRYRGRDLYPKLRKIALEQGETYEKDPIRFDMMLHLGAFVTESSGHFSEYVPYYRKRKDLLRKYTRKSYLGESGFYSKNWPRWRREVDQMRRKALRTVKDETLERSHEYAASIIEAHQLNRPTEIHASVLNEGLIANLPYDGVVEVPVLVNRNGVFPCKFGPLPPQLAALCASNMAVFECTIEGILFGDKEAIYHAMTLDPLTAAVCSPAEVRKMTDEMARRERNYIPKFMNKK